MKLPPITEEFVLWIVAPPVASLAVLAAGLSVRARSARTALIVIGIAGLFLSALWFLLALRVEAIEHRSMEKDPRTQAAPRTRERTQESPRSRVY